MDDVRSECWEFVVRGRRGLLRRCRRNGSTNAATWTLVSVAVAVMLWLSGFRAWPVYLMVAPSLAVAVLLWIGVARKRLRPDRLPSWRPALRTRRPRSG